jgi:hypothetical protein
MSEEARWGEQAKPRAVASDNAIDLADIVWAVIVNSGDPARFLELHYWTAEPKLLELMRILIGLNEETREALHAFLSKIPDPQQIMVNTKPSGVLTVTAPLPCASVLPFRPQRKRSGERAGKYNEPVTEK